MPEYQLSQREADEVARAQAAIDRGMRTGWLRHNTTLPRLAGVGSWVENPAGYVQAYPAGMEPVSHHHATQWSGDREVYTWHRAALHTARGRLSADSSGGRLSVRRVLDSDGEELNDGE